MIEKATRRVIKSGIHFKGSVYFHPDLACAVGETVIIHASATDLSRIEVFNQNSWICTALKVVTRGGDVLPESAPRA